jgi:hypothetical protein
VPALSGQRVTHRIVRITHRGAEATIALKGDANKVPDPQVHTVSSAGRLLFGIPFLGRVIAVLSSPIGLLLLGAYLFFVARVAMEEWAHRGPAGPRRGRERGGRRRGGARRATGVAAGIVALTAGLAAVTGAGPKGTVAAFTDTVAVGTSTMSTSSVPAPTLSCGPLGVLSVGFTWSSVSGATNYTLFYNNGSSSTTVSGLSTTITGALNLSSTAWVVANRNFGSTTWLSARSNSKNYTFLAVVSLCS